VNVQKVTKAVYQDAKTTFTFKTPDNSTVTKTLSKATYQINPVLFDTVYSKNGQNIGYFVFNTFSNVTNSNGPTLTKQEIDRVFAKFSSANISSLIVDFRYNGGGSVNTAEYLDAAIAPANVTGKLMYKYVYNDKLTAMASQVGLETNIFFKNGGNLNLANVFFIGSRNTASASELTLNNLKPYMNVKLVGQTTYGKPVGFFAFTISIFKNKVETFLADLYAINFETRNASDVGGYFDGIKPDITATDFINVPWGNSSDENLQKIFSSLGVGVTNFQAEKSKQKLHKIMDVESPFESLRFNGMVDYKVSRQIENARRNGNGPLLLK
jgi:C-terminal processing protease CtpA/Prc